MIKSKSIFLLAMAFIVAYLFACNSVIAGAGPEIRYKAIPATTESVIAGVTIKYKRNDIGCATSCQFMNDPALCGDNKQCISYAEEINAKAEYINCLDTRLDLTIAGQKIQSGGETTGPAQVCNEFRIITSGSPGWVVNWFNGELKLTCIGYYIESMGCCDTSGKCIPKP